MEAPTAHDKTAWWLHLMRGSPVDVFDSLVDKWRNAVVIECRKSHVQVLFLDTRGRESQWLPRQSRRLALPASPMALSTPADAAATTHASGAAASTPVETESSNDEQAPVSSDVREHGFRQGTTIAVADATLQHWYEARVLVREADRVLVGYKGWPLSHAEWVPVTSDRVTHLDTDLRRWREFEMSQEVQIGFRKSQDGLGASHLTPGLVVSLWNDSERSDDFGLFRVEIVWREPSGVKCEWRDPQDDFLARPGLPMPSVDDDGVVTMTQIIRGEQTTTQLLPTLVSGLCVAPEREAELESDKQKVRESIEVLTCEGKRVVTILDDLTATTRRHMRSIASSTRKMTAELAVVGASESPPPAAADENANATPPRKRTRQD